MGQTVMIVDDSKTIRVQIKHVIKSQGFEIIEAANGAEAIELYKANKDSVFMMFLDINMPVMNGLETLENLSTDDSLEMPNVVVLTTEDSASHVEQAKNFGAKGWIVKPYNTDKLLSALKRFAPAA